MRAADTRLQIAVTMGEPASANQKSKIKTLFGGFGFGGFGALLLALVPVVLALELFNAPGSVDVLHLAGKERVASRADFDRDVFARAACDKLVAATANDGRLNVFGVNAGFHGKPRFQPRI